MPAEAATLAGPVVMEEGKHMQTGTPGLTYKIEPIGLVETPYAELETTPLQSNLNRADQGRIRMFSKFVPGLAGLEGFDFAHLITLLGVGTPDPDTEVDLQPTPLMLRGTGRRIGVFASRFPRRPNSIGLSLIRLLSVAGDTIEFAGVDLLNGTPVLDVKPWVPRLDVPASPELATIRIGWYADVDLSGGTPPGKPANSTNRRRRSSKSSM
jgi:tRNA-Thr(GGU) m(6)t(6)A37 methyltransferase TsaA